MFKSAFIFLFTFCIPQIAFADLLLFKVGDAALYTINQKTYTSIESLNKSKYYTQDLSLTFEVKVLSSNPETLSYPFEVEVILKDIINQQQLVKTKGFYNGNSTFTYNSTDTLEQTHSNDLTKQLAQLIDSPLHFNIKGEFQIEETTGRLKKIRKAYKKLYKQCMGVTPWTFELLLTQLFHLSGTNLQPSKHYPVSCYEMLNWEDAPLDPQKIEVNQNSSYFILSLNSKHAKAVWQAEASVIDREFDWDENSEGKVSLEGNVCWDTNNPLIQQRTLKALIRDTHSALDIKAEVMAEQTWQSQAILSSSVTNS